MDNIVRQVAEERLKNFHPAASRIKQQAFGKAVRVSMG